MGLVSLLSLLWHFLFCLKWEKKLVMKLLNGTPWTGYLFYIVYHAPKSCKPKIFYAEILNEKKKKNSCRCLCLFCYPNIVSLFSGGQQSTHPYLFSCNTVEFILSIFQPNLHKILSSKTKSETSEKSRQFCFAESQWRFELYVVQ